MEEQSQVTNGAGFNSGRSVKCNCTHQCPFSATQECTGICFSVPLKFVLFSRSLKVYLTRKTALTPPQRPAPPPPDQGCTCAPPCPSCPPLAPFRIAYVSQSPSFVKPRCAASNVRDGEKAHLTSVYTQPELPSPRHMTSMLGSRCAEPPSPPLCNSRHLQYQKHASHKLFPFFKMFRENLYLIYGQFIMEIDHIKCIQMCRAVYRAWKETV